MKKLVLFLVISFTFLFLQNSTLFAKDSFSKDILPNGKWYNDEYSFTFSNKGYKAFYTFGKSNGTMIGRIKINKDNSVTIKKGKLDGDFGNFFKSTDEIKMSLVNDPQNPKSTLYLKDSSENIKLWNDSAFVEANKEIYLLNGKIKSITLGYKLSSTTVNVRIRKGPSTDYPYMKFYYKDQKTKSIKSYIAVLKGTNIRLLARTAEKMQVGDWYNNWYYVEYKEPKDGMLIYKSAWMFGEFINVAENKNRKIEVEYPEQESAIYGAYTLEIEGTVTGAPVSMKIQVKNSYGNVTFEDKIARYNQKAGTFSYEVTKENDSLFIGSNIFNLIAVYSDDKEVSKQLTVFLHESQGEKAKPVIYLYPKRKMRVKVKVEPTNGFSETIPEYNNGWEVIAKPNGTLKNLSDKKIYPYLFWESKDYMSSNSKEGFIVLTTELTDFFKEKLNILGLNENEISDFLDFWIPILSKDKYYFIYFYDKQSQDDSAPLIIDPKPDTIIRVFFDSKPLSQPIDIEEQKLIRVERKGFTVTEWGGMRYDK